MTKHIPLTLQFNQVRDVTEAICMPLDVEDYSIQVDWFASPAKWHLAHTTWFYESFILEKYYKNYRRFDEQFSYLFNSYYFSKGKRLTQSERGVLSRPSINKVYEYRQYVNKHVAELLDESDEAINKVLALGLNHEQQHQELLLQDIKYLFGSSPLYPTYIKKDFEFSTEIDDLNFLTIDEGVYEIGHDSNLFSFDNEKGLHKHYLHTANIADRLVTNREFKGFINDGGYDNPLLWLSDGWKWKEKNNISHPLYWTKEDDQWYYFTLHGMRKCDHAAPVTHISFYEAHAFAIWAGFRLPTEFEWEIASKSHYNANEKSNLLEDGNLLALPIQNGDTSFIGNLWEHTESAYLPYPMYKRVKGAFGEYNGKFMVNQKVLRGGSFATPMTHIRHTYRNFYHPSARWMFSGIRLAKHYD